MLQIHLIGVLGMDAQVKSSSGSSFVSFDVAHSESYRSADGTEHKSVIWCNCVLAGDGGNLLQYLKKGKRVYIVGDGSVRVYSSAKHHEMRAGINIRVRTLELLPSSNEVKSISITDNGSTTNVRQLYFVEDDSFLEQLKDGETKEIITNNGLTGNLDRNGFVVLHRK